MFVSARYLYFFEKGNPQVTVASIQGLIELIMNEMQSDTVTTPDPAADAFLASTTRYIQFQKQKGGTVGEKYEPIKVWHADEWYPCSCHVKTSEQFVHGLVQQLFSIVFGFQLKNHKLVCSWLWADRKNYLVIKFGLRFTM